MTTTFDHFAIVRRPLMTEKASLQQDMHNQYIFMVRRGANKVEIRQAVEQLFEVNVVSVNTLRVRGKWRVRGRSIGRSQAWKKAMVVFKDGQTIDLL